MGNKFRQLQNKIPFPHSLREKVTKLQHGITILHTLKKKVIYLNRAPVIKTGAMNKLLGAFAQTWGNQLIPCEIKKVES